MDSSTINALNYLSYWGALPAPASIIPPLYRWGIESAIRTGLISYTPSAIGSSLTLSSKGARLLGKNGYLPPSQARRTHLLLAYLAHHALLPEGWRKISKCKDTAWLITHSSGATALVLTGYPNISKHTRKYLGSYFLCRPERPHTRFYLATTVTGPKPNIDAEYVSNRSYRYWLEYMKSFTRK